MGGGGGSGAESYDRKKAWSSKNHPIISGLGVRHRVYERDSIRKYFHDTDSGPPPNGYTTTGACGLEKKALSIKKREERENELTLWYRRRGEGTGRGGGRGGQTQTYDCVSIIGADTDEIGVFLKQSNRHIFMDDIIKKV
jgi:hypothetical protein